MLRCALHMTHFANFMDVSHDEFPHNGALVLLHLHPASVSLNNRLLHDQPKQKVGRVNGLGSRGEEQIYCLAKGPVKPWELFCLLNYTLHPTTTKQTCMHSPGSPPDTTVTHGPLTSVRVCLE